MLSMRMCSNLLQQRTDMRDLLENHYLAEMADLFDNISPHLPAEVRSVLDVGCGLGGINIFTARRFPDAVVYLLDRDGDTGSKIGWHDGADAFGCYNNLQDTKTFLRSHGVKNKLVLLQELPKGFESDLVYSFLSWGFHYPLNTYHPKAKTLIVDIRRDHEDPPAGSAVIYRGRKHDRCCVENFLRT
jgi:SAM-dependent methyltransferase